MLHRAAVLLPLALCLVGSVRAQDSTPSLIGAWSAQLPDPTTGGQIYATEVYNPDGTFVATMALPTGGLMRIGGHYQLQPTGSNQVQDTETAEAILPRQVCVGSLASCQPGPPLSGPQTVTLTFLDANTVQSVGPSGTIVSHRDPNPMLAQAYVPDTLMRPGNVSPGPSPAPVVNNVCTLGTTTCINGWVAPCEAWAGGGTHWGTSGSRC